MLSEKKWRKEDMVWEDIGCERMVRKEVFRKEVDRMNVVGKDMVQQELARMEVVGKHLDQEEVVRKETSVEGYLSTVRPQRGGDYQN
jgi:hypothetical protein